MSIFYNPKKRGVFGGYILNTNEPIYNHLDYKNGMSNKFGGGGEGPDGEGACDDTL